MKSSRVIHTDKSAVYVRLPLEMQREIQGACACDYCLAHPEHVPMWDTLAVPTTKGEYTWTVHMPEHGGDKVLRALPLGQLLKESE